MILLDDVLMEGAEKTAVKLRQEIEATDKSR